MDETGKEKIMSNKTLWIIGGGIAVAAAVYFATKDKKADLVTDADPLSPEPSQNNEVQNSYPDDWQPMPGKNYTNDPAYQDWFKRLQIREQNAVPAPKPLPIGVQTNPVPEYFQPPPPATPAYVQAYNPPFTEPIVEPVYVPPVYAPITKQIINPDVSAQPPSVNPLLQKYPSGSLVRAGDSDKVYLVNAQGQIQWFKNRKAFDSRGYNMKNVKSISSSDMSKFQRGADLAGFGLGNAYLFN